MQMYSGHGPMSSRANLPASHGQEGMVLLSFPPPILLTMQFRLFPCAGSGTPDTFVGSKTSILFLYFSGLAL